jgi:hypothetical protein
MPPIAFVKQSTTSVVRKDRNTNRGFIAAEVGAQRTSYQRAPSAYASIPTTCARKNLSRLRGFGNYHHGRRRGSQKKIDLLRYNPRVMKIGLFALICISLVLPVSCGGSGTVSNNGGGGGPGGVTSSDETVTISPTTSVPFSVAMSTSFQPAEWDYQFFNLNPTATTTLGDLAPHHVRLQGISQGVPQTTASTWDFALLDTITQPVLSVGDRSPEFQIATGPAFMYDANHNFLDATYQQFAAYAQDLVEYYNTGGFSAADGQHASPSGIPITWWGIYNEPNFNNLSSTQYTQLYNVVVPAMQAVDPSLKYAAVELGDYSGLANQFMPPFVSGVTAHVDVLATHFYSTCHQTDTDSTLFATVPGFAAEVGDIYTQLNTNPALVSVPVWVTENNVNADFSVNGKSMCDQSHAFVPDPRGSSPFFAAWRPYVFSQLGRAGVRALYHWDFGADVQYGEVDYNTGALQLSYWVDYWLGRMFPPDTGSQVLQHTSTDDGELETLAVLNSDNSVVVMIANHAIDAATDNDGLGVSKTVTVDVSALGSFATANLLVIDNKTNVASGPSATPVTPASKITMNLEGYSVGFLGLKP